MKFAFVGIGIAIVIGLIAVASISSIENESNPPVTNRIVETEPEHPESKPSAIKEQESRPQAESKSLLQPTQSTFSDKSEPNCSGDARCFSGKVTEVIDGDTIRVNGHSIRFALSSAQELYEPSGQTARSLINTMCPVGSKALVDEDDGQTQGSYGRILAVIYCNGVNLNEELLDSGLGYLASEFCDVSEFAATYWAKKHGCQEDKPQTTDTKSDCDDSYPDFCISPPPPDLDCKDIPHKRFNVLQPDPHRFDGDKDGIGCES